MVPGVLLNHSGNHMVGTKIQLLIVKVGNCLSKRDDSLFFVKMKKS